MTAVNTQTSPAALDTAEDHLSHRFCKTQSTAWLQGEPATARCGKTKPDWEPADGTDLLCIICLHYWQNQQCEHCNQQNQGAH